MVGFKRLVGVLLIVTIILSVVFITLNVTIFNLFSLDSSGVEKFPSNSGNIGLIVEGSNKNIGGDNG